MIVLYVLQVSKFVVPEKKNIIEKRERIFKGLSSKFSLCCPKKG